MRYHRQIILPGFGHKSQNKLSKSSVLIIGAGGLGVPVMQYLTAAGVGHIGIVDNDNVDKTNLHRQVIYTESEIGRSKANLAKAKMTALNSEVRIDSFHTQLSRENAFKIIEPFDVIVDCTDNFPTRYLTNDASYLKQKPLVYGAIYRWEGQVSVFNYKGSANYRDIFPNPPQPDQIPNCAEGGVIGVLPGIIGSLMANECIKILSETGDVLSNKLLMYDAKTSVFHTVKYKKRTDNPLSGDMPTVTDLIDYDVFCGIEKSNGTIGEITSSMLKQWKSDGKDFQLIDVRELNEYEAINIGGENIPVSKIKTETHKIEDDIPVVIICQTGKRSMSVLQFLKKEHDFENLLSLKGGINSYLIE